MRHGRTLLPGSSINQIISLCARTHALPEIIGILTKNCYHFTQCVQIAQRLEQLSVTREEYYLLKALVLVNCDVRVESMAHVKKLRETVLSALSDCSAALRYTSSIIGLSD